MKLHKHLLEELVVTPGERAGLLSRSTTQTTVNWLGAIGRSSPKEVAEQDLEAFKKDLQAAQELLYASDMWALLLVFQAVDAAGKDGTIKHVMSGVNPQGCEVFSFKQPSAEELRHDFLWRCSKLLPERGRIGIFNRSYYEEVLVVRVHPELLSAERLPSGTAPEPRLWRERYDDINSFERHLHRNGTRIVKFFLHVSKDEQRRRFLDRLEDPTKRWKFSLEDFAEHAHFDEYQKVYEEVLTSTSTPWAPWYVVPADHKSAMRALVGGIVVSVVDQLDLGFPVVDERREEELSSARRQLLSETPVDRTP
jgi:PPK2 family polyphosphate:nucleotide phosphotransferase